MPPPLWAQNLVIQVALDEGRNELPDLVWRKSRIQWGVSGHAKSGCLGQADQITIKVGVPHPHYPIRTEQKIVLLHELAHWLLPVGEHHSPAFWDKAWSLFRRYRCPIKVALAREGNYLKGAVTAYHRSVSPRKER